MGGPNDSYEILERAPGASPEEVKDAYIESAKVWHPNLFLDDDLVRRIAEEKMAEIDAAYDTLKAFFSPIVPRAVPGIMVHPANEYLQDEKGEYLSAVNSAPGGSRVSLALKGFCCPEGA